MNERRIDKRVPLSVLLEMYSEGKMHKQSDGFITDISEGGLALETKERLNTGSAFCLKFVLPNKWEFDILGKIQYFKEGVLSKKYGVKFTKISKIDNEKIKEYVIARVEK